MKLAGFAALAIHWFNPLVWVAYILMCKDIEMACDESVVKNMALEERKAYSAALLSCSASRRSIAACPVAFGEVSVKGRIIKVLNYRKKSFWFSLIAVIVIIFVAVCFLTSPAAKEPDLSFLNYQNAVPLAAEQDVLAAVHYTEKGEESSIGIGMAEGEALARYLDSVEWTEKWFKPSDRSSPGSVAFNITDAYRITVYDRRFAAVEFDGEVRYYRIGRNDYAAAVDMVLPADQERLQRDFDIHLGTATRDFDIHLGTATREFDIHLGTATMEYSHVWLDYCKNALEEFQAQEAYCLMAQWQFSGDILNDNSTQFFYRNGDSWMRHTLISGVDQSVEVWYLEKDGVRYERSTSIIHDPANGESSDSGWMETTQIDGDALKCWLAVFDWDAAQIELIDAASGVNGDTVSFTVQGSPFGGDETVEEYTVTFVFNKGAELLRSVNMSYSSRWPMYADGKETTGVANHVGTIYLNAMAPEDAAAAIERVYSQEIAGA